MAVKTTRTLEISLSDEEYEKLYMKSFQGALSPDRLTELFIRSLLDEGAKLEGSEQIRQWFSQISKSQAMPELFHQYLARQGKLVDFVMLALKKKDAETKNEELRPRMQGKGTIAGREAARKEIEEECVPTLECLDEMQEIYSKYKEKNPKTKFSFEDAIQSAVNTYASMQTAITGEPYTFPDGSQLVNIQTANAHMPPDRITFDFQKNQVIWETPEKEGTDSFVCARDMRPLILDILGEGEHDLSALAGFINTIAQDDELARRFYEAEMTQATGNPASGENVFGDVFKTVEIEATVLEKTYQSLKGMMKESGGTMGDVIDKLSVHFAPREPEFAIHLATEELGMCLSGLEPADTKKALIQIAAILMSAMTIEEQNEVYEGAVAAQRELVERLRAMDKKGLGKLADALKRLLKNK